MKIGFTGTRHSLELHQQRLVESVLVSLLPTMTYGITGACYGVDAFVAKWLAQNSDAQQIIIVPAKRELVDTTLYALPRAVLIEMPVMGDERSNNSLPYRRRNEKIVELSERLVAFYKGNPHSGTKMTMNIAERQGKLTPGDIHKI